MGSSVINTCAVCGKEFVVWKSALERGKGRCCSKTCANIWRTGKPAPKTKERSDKKPRKSYVCQWCGKVFQEDRPRSKPLVFCSNKCSGASKKKSGQFHPRKKYNNSLTLWARAVILRDKQCIRCGATTGLQAHHIKSWKHNPDVGLDVNNGATLCAPCHHAQHPGMGFETFMTRPGKTVVMCVVCETPYIQWKSDQRTCSLKCGQHLRRDKERTAEIPDEY